MSQQSIPTVLQRQDRLDPADAAPVQSNAARAMAASRETPASTGPAPLGDAVEGAEPDSVAILICLLGSFRVLQGGRPVVIRGGGKVEALLRVLALQRDGGIPRETVLGILWPNSDLDLASQSLNSLIYTLHKTVRDALGNHPPIRCSDGYCRLNAEAGVSSDVFQFETLADLGDKHRRANSPDQATACYLRAVQLYQGDLSATESDVQFVIRREGLRSRYLTLLAHVADYSFARADYPAGLEYAFRMLNSDPCREDAYRLAMRCHARLGERAQALRDYRLCQTVLRTEFDAEPEPATFALFERIRLDPGNI